MNDKWGKLKIWGTDENGYWEKTIDCYYSEIGSILGRYRPYDREYEFDYDFMEA